MRLLHTPHPSTTTGKLFQQRGINRVADSGASMVLEAPFRRSSGNPTSALILRLKLTHRIALNSVGIGSWKEGNRRVQAAPDGIAPGNAEAESREQILEKARAESASTIDDEQEPFRDSVESGTIGEATAELQFGTGDSNTSNELVKQGKSGGATKEEDKAEEDPKAELTSEVWGSKDDMGSTHAFLDDEKNVDIRGEEMSQFWEDRELVKVIQIIIRKHNNSHNADPKTIMKKESVGEFDKTLLMDVKAISEEGCEI